MRSILIVFGLAFSLVITPANAEESRNYWIGYIVTWVDLCNYFRGYTVDRLRIKAIREAYEDDKDFQRGYKRERRLFSADTVMGLGDCEEVLGYFAEIDVSAVSSSASASGTSQQITADLPSSFDGDWVLEIVDQDNRSQGHRVETKITDGEFSLDFLAGGWRGTITGEIDRAGRLSATTSARRSKVVMNFSFSASYKNGSFQTIVKGYPRGVGLTEALDFSNAPVDFEITLTQKPPIE